MMRVLVIQVFAVLILIGLYDCGGDTECGENCFIDKRDNRTMTCTDVPSCIPEEVTRVVVNDTSFNPAVITTSNFTGKNWDKVTFLRLHDKDPSKNKVWILSEACFVSLESVEELYINIKQLTIDENSMVGLSSVKVIDFTGCYSMGIDELLLLLNGTNKLARLNTIGLADWNIYNQPYDFDDKLINVLLPRNITDIDVSKSHIKLLNLTTVLKRMVHLNSIDLTQTFTAAIYLDDLHVDDIKHLDTLTVNSFGFPYEVPSRYVVRNTTFFGLDSTGFMQLIFSVSNVYATGIIQQRTLIWIENCQIIMTEKSHFRIKALQLNGNNIIRLDLRIVGGNLTLDLENLEMSDNGLEYLHSSILSSMPFLKELDLCGNRLYKMCEEDPEQFGQLLSGVPSLTYANFAINNLTHVPRDFFKGCGNLSTIDLSYNKLTHITFSVSDLTSLCNIFMIGNNIKTLDATALNNLNSFLSNDCGYVEGRNLSLTLNPISCSVCESKHFLQWILSTHTVDVQAQRLDCIDENGNRIDIDETAISAVHDICIRTTVIISLTISTTITLISAVSVFLWLYKRRTLAKTLAHRRAMNTKIRGGDGPYEFPVFLSFSSLDDAFALDNVLPNLNDNLRRIVKGINIDRNLVCIGDATLRPGFYVHDEIDVCLDRSSVVIILVTENYCKSQYCRNELEKAYMKNKAVVLMFKEHVSEDLMSRTMKELYKRNVRILWVEQNGEYVLQTTWENVCTSIIDLIK